MKGKGRDVTLVSNKHDPQATTDDTLPTPHPAFAPFALTCGL